MLTLLGLVLLKPLLEGMQSFLKDLPQTVDQLKSSSELGFLKDTGAADNVSSGAQSVSSSVPDALGALVGFAGSIASLALDVFLITFICLFFLCEVAELKAALASVLPKGQEEVWLPLWDRVTTMVSRWAIGVAIIATIAGTVQGTTAYLLGSSYAVALGLLAGFLDMIPNIGATIAGFILSITLFAEEGLTAALIMLAVVLIYQQVENSVLTPTIQGKAVKLSAFFIIISVALFGALLGVVGALIAVPVAATIQIVLGEVTKTYRAQIAAGKAEAGKPCPPARARVPDPVASPASDAAVDPGVASAPAAVKVGWGVAAILATAQFVMVLDTTVMNVSITQVVADLNTTVVGLQTAITMYTLVMAAFMLIGGKIGDRWGAKRAFWIGGLVYGAGSLTTALSPNLGVLLIGWSLVEGLGAVLVIPAIAALTAATYQGKQRAMAYGILGGVSGASMAAGPIIGGWVTANLSWRYVFAGETVVMLILMLFLKVLPATVGRKSKLDLGGAVLSAAGLGAAVFGVLKSSQWGWVTAKAAAPVSPLGLSPTLWLIAIGSVLLWLFVRQEERVKERGQEPLLDLALPQIPRMRAGLVVQWCQAFIIQGTFFVIPLYLQTVLGFDALKTGKTILPMSVAMFVFAIAGSAITGRYSPKRIVQRGVAAMLVGEAVLLHFIGPELERLGLRDRAGAARSRPRAARLAGRQRDHVVGRSLPRRRSRRAPGHLAQPRRLPRRRARRLDPDRLPGHELHDRGEGEPEPDRPRQATGGRGLREERQLRLHRPGRAGSEGRTRAATPDGRARRRLLRLTAPGATGRARIPRPLRAPHARLGTTPTQPRTLRPRRRRRTTNTRNTRQTPPARPPRLTALAVCANEQEIRTIKSITRTPERRGRDAAPGAVRGLMPRQNRTCLGRPLPALIQDLEASGYSIRRKP